MSQNANPALRLAVEEIMADLRREGREIDFIPIAEGLVARGFGHVPMGDLRAVVREKIALLKGDRHE